MIEKTSRYIVLKLAAWGLEVWKEKNLTSYYSLKLMWWHMVIAAWESTLNFNVECVEP